jgi:hypothetical protein
VFSKFNFGSVRNVNVWASHTDFGNVTANPGKYLKDLKYPSGDSRGQGGWNVPLRFANLDDLAAQLERGVKVLDEFYPSDVGSRGAPPIRRGEIARLAIMVHGTQGGRLMVNGKVSPRQLAADTIRDYQTALTKIGLFTKPQLSTILFMGCLAGQGDPGTRLLAGLSRVWPGRTVVGFTTIGYRHPGAMTPVASDYGAELPGMRDTDIPSGIFVGPSALQKLDAAWNDPAKLPWASEESLHAKVLRDGVVVRCPAGEVCRAGP